MKKSNYQQPAIQVIDMRPQHIIAATQATPGPSAGYMSDPGISGSRGAVDDEYDEED